MKKIEKVFQSDVMSLKIKNGGLSHISTSRPAENWWMLFERAKAWKVKLGQIHGNIQ